MDEWLATSGLKPTSGWSVLNPAPGARTSAAPSVNRRDAGRRLAHDAARPRRADVGPGEEGTARHRRGRPAAEARVLAPPTISTRCWPCCAGQRRWSPPTRGPCTWPPRLGTPCVGLYGPTSPARNGPYGAGHRVLWSDDRTMAGLAPEAVLAAVSELLDERARALSWWW
jgi:heptosyltransferase-1